MKKEILAYKKGYRVTESGNAIGPTGKVLKTYDCDGYLRINIGYLGKKIPCPIHRLVAFQKFGLDIYKQGIEVRHKDSNSRNNNHENIIIGTHRDNAMDTPEAIRISRALHATSFTRKYNKEKVKIFHAKNGNSYKKTMAHFNMSSTGTLYYILNN